MLNQCNLFNSCKPVFLDKKVLSSTTCRVGEAAYEINGLEVKVRWKSVKVSFDFSYLCLVL